MSFKVFQIIDLGINRKPICNFRLMNTRFYFVPFHIYGGVFVKFLILTGNVSP